MTCADVTPSLSSEPPHHVASSSPRLSVLLLPSMTMPLSPGTRNMAQHFEPVDVPKLKVAELKDELAKRGLETTGLKKDVSAPVTATEQC